MSEFRITELLAFRGEGVIDCPAPLPAKPYPFPIDDTFRQIEGWVAGRLREVRRWQIEDCLYLQIVGIGVFGVEAGCEVITCYQLDRKVTPAQFTETLLGPPLVMALAQRGIYCLHAAAILVDGQAIAFVGDSGAGKSTVAAYLDDRTPWTRLADDVLPVMWSTSGPVVRPHFPQLKLSAGQQNRAAIPQAVPLKAIYLVDTSGFSYPTITPERKRQATTTLIRQTMATGLFSSDLLAAHLDFCARAATVIEVGRLAYPRTYEALPLVFATLAGITKRVKVI